MPSKPKYKRVMLKLSGEVLSGGLGGFRGESAAGGKRRTGVSIDSAVLESLCKEIAEVKKLGVQIVIVIGGGNIWRFRDFKETGIDRVTSDNIGMLATIMNAVAMQSMFEKLGTECRVSSAVNIPQIAEPYLRRKAVRHLEKGRIVICAGGTGSPFFTTDSAAALRALETGCEVLMKATNVDGVYDKDPDIYKGAKKFSLLTYHKVLEMDLKFMDSAAVSLCKESFVPILVFNLKKYGNIKRAVLGETLGTLIH